MRERTRRVGTREGRSNRVFAHQQEAVSYALNGKKTVVYAHDVGMGKTFTALAYYAAMHTIEGGVLRRLCISAPAAVLHQWMETCLDSLRLPASKILMTNKLAKVTPEALEKYSIFILSRDTISGAFSTCFEWATPDGGIAGWQRKPGTELHPLIAFQFDDFFIDELHFLRNRKTAWTRSHEQVSMRTKNMVLGLTATPIQNSPTNLIGIAVGMNCAEEYKSNPHWFADKQQSRIRMDVVRSFRQKYFHRASDDVLNLPPIITEDITFAPGFSKEAVELYNESVQATRRFRIFAERRGAATNASLIRLMGMLQRLQQFMVSPLLAEHGAAATKADEELIERCARQETGVLKALAAQITQARREGHERVLIACSKVSIIQVAKRYLELFMPDVGQIFSYVGSMTLTQRRAAARNFLEGDRTVMLLSIDAGGTGLHLVPGCNYMIFFGAMPFSPEQVKQVCGRLRRVGQTLPVKAVQLVSAGSVDDAIRKVHRDKTELSRAVLEDEVDPLVERGGKWRTTGRITDGVRTIGEDGNFLTEDEENAKIEAERQKRIEEARVAAYERRALHVQAQQQDARNAAKQRASQAAAAAQAARVQQREAHAQMAAQKALDDSRRKAHAILGMTASGSNVTKTIQKKPVTAVAPHLTLRHFNRKSKDPAPNVPQQGVASSSSSAPNVSASVMVPPFVKRFSTPTA
jgi:hypothetical protein